MLRDRNLPSSGKKSVLIERLIESFKKEHGITKDCRVTLSRINLDDGPKTDTGEKKVPSSMTHHKPNHMKNSIQTVKSTTVEKKEADKYEKPQTRSMAQHYKLKLTQNKSQSSKKTVVDEPPKKKTRNMNHEVRKSTARAKEIQKRKPRQMKKVASTALCLKPTLQKYEMVWAHVKGFRNWPGIIEGETKSGKYKIHFFGDYSSSDVSKNKIMHLLEGFKDYAVADRPTPLLKKAITEAQMFILDKNVRTTCPICDMLKLKTNDNRIY